jgi:hypothetical protein
VHDLSAPTSRAGVDRALTTNNQLVKLENLFRFVFVPSPNGGFVRQETNATIVVDQIDPGYESGLMSIEVQVLRVQL